MQPDFCRSCCRVLLVAFALFVPNFVAVQNLLNVLRSSSYLVIIAAGQMLVLIVGGFDLSQGAVVALTSVTSALVMVAFKDTFANEPGLIILIGVLAGLGCGVIVGLVNGLCVAFLRISPFMVTLGTMSIATGFALLLTSGIPVYGMPKSYVEGFGRGLWLDLPTAFYLAAAVVAVIWVMQNYTRMGRYILAIGGNMQAAVVSGVPAKTYLILSYVICSVLASVSGLAFTAQLGSGQAVINAQLTLESIAAAVIAGVSIKGGVGRGRVGGARRSSSAHADRCDGPAADRPAHSGDLPRHHRRGGRGARRAFAEESGACLKPASPGSASSPLPRDRGTARRPVGASLCCCRC